MRSAQWAGTWSNSVSSDCQVPGQSSQSDAPKLLPWQKSAMFFVHEAAKGVIKTQWHRANAWSRTAKLGKARHRRQDAFQTEPVQLVPSSLQIHVRHGTADPPKGISFSGNPVGGYQVCWVCVGFVKTSLCNATTSSVPKPPGKLS